MLHSSVLDFTAKWKHLSVESEKPLTLVYTVLALIVYV